MASHTRSESLPQCLTDLMCNGTKLSARLGQSILGGSSPASAMAGSEIVGKSEAIQKVINTISQAARDDAPVLILGQTGVGKELVAEAIHRASQRNQHRMVTLNCAAISPHLIESKLFGHRKGSFTHAFRDENGKFLQADKSTLLLDEIADLSVEAQAKVLRVLQEHEIEPIGGDNTPVDVRIIAATNKDLPKEIQAGRFREDLLYRLKGHTVEVPPLRSRREDVPRLAEYFVQRDRWHTRRGQQLTWHPDAMKALVGYDFPGNVRELENEIVTHAMSQALSAGRSEILKEDLPAAVLTSERTPRAAHDLTESDRLAIRSTQPSQELGDWPIDRFMPDELAMARHATISDEIAAAIGKRYGPSLSSGDHVRIEVFLRGVLKTLGDVYVTIAEQNGAKSTAVPSRRRGALLGRLAASLVTMGMTTDDAKALCLASSRETGWYLKNWSPTATKNLERKASDLAKTEQPGSTPS